MKIKNFYSSWPLYSYQCVTNPSYTGFLFFFFYKRSKFPVIFGEHIPKIIKFTAVIWQLWFNGYKSAIQVVIWTNWLSVRFYIFIVPPFKKKVFFFVLFFILPIFQLLFLYLILFLFFPFYFSKQLWNFAYLFLLHFLNI